MNSQKLLTLTVIGMLIAGSAGYVIVEGWPVLDAVFMTLITLSTVGFGEVHELSPAGRAYTSMLVAASFVLMACWTASLTSQWVSGEISGRYRQQRERRMIQKMQNHTILCGGGHLARAIASSLWQAEHSLVMIIHDPSTAAIVRQLMPQIPIIEADEKSELAMIDANILQASNLIAATISDTDNLLIAITGRGLGTELRIFACAESPEWASRMSKVGADEVICPAIVGGEQVAKLVCPDVSQLTQSLPTLGEREPLPITAVSLANQIGKLLQ
ncbi:MAG: potassium channel family protein [bacterium]|nr:potassium channel family protein [bacterium]